MKKLLLAIFFMGLVSLPLLSQAQSSTSTPKFVKFGKIPSFSFTEVGKKSFTNKDIKEGVPTMIFLFSVNCSHCQHMTKEIVKNIDKFKHAQILMITPFNYKQMYAYYRGFGLQNYQDVITMGSDPTRKLNMFYNQRYYPGIYIYDAEGHLAFHHEGDIDINSLAKYLK